MSESDAPFQLSILVVDDDDQVRLLLVRQLTKEGYSVHPVVNGLEAKTAMLNIKFDLVLLDLNMPEMDGFEVLRFVRLEQPNSKIIVVSGLFQNAMLNASKVLGAAAILQKPIDSVLLLATIHRVLGDRAEPV